MKRSIVRRSRGFLNDQRYAPMRLNAEETASIKRIVSEVFGDDVTVRLFGSRVDDARRGGDVDLYVVPAQGDGLFDKRIICLAKLEAALPYPVDLVVHEPGRDLPIYRIARMQGVTL